MPGMSYPSDLTDDQWALLEPVFRAPGRCGRKHAGDLRTVVDAMLYIAQTGCQRRYLPASFGPWTRIWSQFRRWSRNGTWAPALTVPHAAARIEDGRTEENPREPGQRVDAGAPGQAGRHRPARAGYGRPGVTAAAARALGRDHGFEVRRVGWDDKQPVFLPIRHTWRVEVAHGTSTANDAVLAEGEAASKR
jgi:transposase